MEPDVKQRVIDIVGAENFTEQLIDMVSFGRDSYNFSRRPEAAVWVTSREQVAALMKLANAHRFPVTPRGAGTALTGSAVPMKGGLVMDLSRMNRILKISIEDRLVVTEPGVIFDELNKALAPHGFFFPPNPASGKVSTLGGNIATNAGGVKGAKYGTTRDYVLDLEVVLPDGSVLHTGSRTMKNVSGYDLTRLFVGSEGTLGVVTEITLKINPLPRATTTCTATFASLVEAGQAVSDIMRSGVIPSVLELMDRFCLQAVNQATDLKLPEAEAMLLIETDGFTPQEADGQMDVVAAALQKNNAGEIVHARTAAEAAKLWAARKGIYGIMTRLNYNILSEDLVVPISRVPEMLGEIQAIARRSGLLIATVAHAGDGNIHPMMVYDGTQPEEVARVREVEAELFRLAIRLGGTLTGEHGVGMSKAAYMPMEHDAVFIDVMNRLKAALDPNAVLNPGKLGLNV
jgi:glycolate oxidase